MIRLFSSCARAFLIFSIRLYQSFLSPLFPPCCRYYPTCSAYALEALERHGVVRGCYFAARRLLRCHPWAPGGVDPVPPLRHHPLSARRY